MGDTGVLDAWSSDVCQEVAQEILNRFARTGTNAIQYKEWKELMQSCWQEHNMIAEEEGKSDEQPPLAQTFSNRSVVDGEYRYTNKVEWAYEALVEANGLTP